MTFLLAVATGALYAGGFYLMMRRSLFKMIMGVVLMGHAANLLIFTLGGLVRGLPPYIAEGQKHLGEHFADPLPQALILTAIVIGFGVNAFGVVLIRRVHESVKTGDLDEMIETDSPEELLK